MNPELFAAIREAANVLGVDPIDLATAMAYETGGTFDPWQRGPTTKWGEHRGLIQWGEPQRAEYGVTQDTPVRDQVMAAARYLKDRGVAPGMGLSEIYSAINAGRVGRLNVSDRPGWDVTRHIRTMETAHRPRVTRLFEEGEGRGASKPKQKPHAEEIRASSPEKRRALVKSLTGTRATKANFDPVEGGSQYDYIVGFDPEGRSVTSYIDGRGRAHSFYTYDPSINSETPKGFLRGLFGLGL